MPKDREGALRCLPNATGGGSASAHVVVELGVDDTSARSRPDGSVFAFGSVLPSAGNHVTGGSSSLDSSQWAVKGDPSVHRPLSDLYAAQTGTGFSAGARRGESGPHDVENTHEGALAELGQTRRSMSLTSYRVPGIDGSYRVHGIDGIPLGISRHGSQVGLESSSFVRRGSQVLLESSSSVRRGSQVGLWLPDQRGSGSESSDRLSSAVLLMNRRTGGNGLCSGEDEAPNSPFARAKASAAVRSSSSRSTSFAITSPDGMARPHSLVEPRTDSLSMATAALLSGGTGGPTLSSSSTSPRRRPVRASPSAALLSRLQEAATSGHTLLPPVKPYKETDFSRRSECLGKQNQIPETESSEIPESESLQPRSSLRLNRCKGGCMGGGAYFLYSCGTHKFTPLMHLCPMQQSYPIGHIGPEAVKEALCLFCRNTAAPLRLYGTAAF